VPRRGRGTAATTMSARGRPCWAVWEVQRYGKREAMRDEMRQQGDAGWRAREVERWRGGERETSARGEVAGAHAAPAPIQLARTTSATRLYSPEAAAEESRLRRRRGKIQDYESGRLLLSPPPPARLTSIFCLEPLTTHTTTHTSLVSHSHPSGHSAKHLPHARFVNS
jgi:hypothetical protein